MDLYNYFNSQAWMINRPRRFGYDITNFRLPTKLNLSILKEKSSSQPRALQSSRQKSQHAWDQLSVEKRNASFHSRRMERDSSCHSQRAQTVRFCDVKQILLQETNRQTILNLDKRYQNDPQYCYIYAHEISEYMRSIQNLYISRQLDQMQITKKMRSILIDWLIDVEFKFKLKPETLFLTINILDRYLGIKQVTKNEFQLLGVTCLLIASKMDEIYSPQLKDLTFITENSFTKSQIIAYESQILQTLSFNLTGPTIYYFLQRFNMISQLNIKHFYLAQMLCELYLINNQQEIVASIIAGSAIYLVRKLKHYSPQWTGDLQIASDLDEKQLKDISKQMQSYFTECQKIQQPKSSIYNAVQSKYQSIKPDNSMIANTTSFQHFLCLFHHQYNILRENTFLIIILIIHNNILILNQLSLLKNQKNVINSNLKNEKTNFSPLKQNIMQK
ncbi:cell division [Paramecium bursaria]